MMSRLLTLQRPAEIERVHAGLQRNESRRTAALRGGAGAGDLAAYQLIDAATIAESMEAALEMCTNVHIPLPANEGGAGGRASAFPPLPAV